MWLNCVDISLPAVEQNIICSINSLCFSFQIISLLSFLVSVFLALGLHVVIYDDYPEFEVIPGVDDLLKG